MLVKSCLSFIARNERYASSHISNSRIARGTQILVESTTQRIDFIENFISSAVHPKDLLDYVREL